VPGRIAVAGSVVQALAPGALRALDQEVLARFLEAQRWYGGKARGVSGVRFVEIVPVMWDGDAAVLSRVEVEHPGGAEGREVVSYQLPLVVRPAAAVGDAARSRRVLAVVEREGAGGAGATEGAEGAERGAGDARAVIVDALADADFRAHLVAAMARGETASGDGATWRFERTEGGSAGEVEALALLPSRLVGGEQSNTSVVYGDRGILKVFRVLQPGGNPDVEITAFLTTRTAFRHTPPLLGVMELRGSDGLTRVAGMLSRYLPGAVDGWTHALARLRPYLRSPGREVPANPFVREAARLGAVTRELHDALASDPSVPGFAREPVTAVDVEAWVEQTRRTAEGALDLLEARLPALEARTAAMGRAIARRRREVLECIAAAAQRVRQAPSLGDKTRHHGDYHLGQVLYTTEGDWMVIDFEGEPARPLAVRRALASPLRDVAGMLRSFAYAAATAGAEVGGLGVNPTVEIRAAHWERDARAAFLDAYRVSPDHPVIALLEMEKVFYELAYELNNRPEWAWIPCRGIAKIF
jgi:trehalose synthase-fused probable maltokinase